jgi:hypothetical protein
MYLLYVDESGEPNNVSDKHFVLGGVAVFERQIYHLNEALNELQQQYFPTIGDQIEFHASDMYRRNKEPWHSLPRAKCDEITQSVYRVIRDSNQQGVNLFSVVIDRGFQSVSDLVGRSFEELCNRFDLYLTRLHKEQNEQRGIMILDDSRYEERLKQLLAIYRTTGTRYGTVYNLPETPVFTDSKTTRMLQLADFCSWAVFRRYEHGDTRYLDTIINRFDNSDGIIHGLVHLTTNRTCTCTYCLTKKLRP